MRAAWYDTQGPSSVLQVGELPDPEPGEGEVRVRVTRSGINPGDVKKRTGEYSGMAYPRVVPHSDGVGVIDAVGPGADAARIGRRVWVHGAQSYRQLGTAAEYVVVPEPLAVDLPDGVSDDLGAALGIPGITAHRAVFGDGPVSGSTVLVHGVRGAVSSLAAQLAAWGGATVIGTVRTATSAAVRGVSSLVALDDDPAAAVLRLAPGGVDRIVEVALDANADLDAAVIRNLGVIAAYATHDDRPGLPFWPMLFQNTTIRLLGSDDFPEAAKAQAAADLSAAAAAGALEAPVAAVLPLDRIAEAHDAVMDPAVHGRVLLSID
ncbi:NADPH:quinone reductase [Amnibacterium setariae]|uniref:NADPH:quinone reductase n=1 Tax=Amnibacterium setariae TaxID=2306585 RepID=A0A3A1U4U5_9MICO|nr:NADPH:quinone reductase [Amnibacterium setariae]RIX31373.1 NADPH:quinone reductase [Amnibacterium setariae]